MLQGHAADGVAPRSGKRGLIYQCIVYSFGLSIDGVGGSEGRIMKNEDALGQKR